MAAMNSELRRKDMEYKSATQGTPIIVKSRAAKNHSPFFGEHQQYFYGYNEISTHNSLFAD